MGKLTGVEGECTGAHPWGVLFRAEAGGYVPVQDGPDLVLTLDRNCSMPPTHSLAGTDGDWRRERQHPRDGPATGAIIAMPSGPR